MTSEVCSLLRVHDSAYRSGGQECAQGGQSFYQASGKRRGPTQAGYTDTLVIQGTPVECGRKSRLPDRSSNFFASFQVSTTTAQERAGPLVLSDQPALMTDSEHTRRTLARVNPWESGRSQRHPWKFVQGMC